MKKRHNQWSDVPIQFGIEVGVEGDEPGAWCDITGGNVLPVAIVDELRTLLPEVFASRDGGCFLDFDVRGEGWCDGGDRETPPCHCDMRDVVGIEALPAIPLPQIGGYAKKGKQLSPASVAILAKMYAREIDDADMPEWDEP